MSDTGPQSDTIIHGSAVAIDGRALLIIGPSGSGKSSLALELIALGATLVADDRVVVTKDPTHGVLVAPPPTIEGMIEARCLGLLRTEFCRARLRAVVDLTRVEGARLPEPYETVISGVTFPCLQKVESPAFASMLLVYMRGERTAP